MGSSSWSSDAFSHLSSSRASASTGDIFANSKTGVARKDMLPAGIKFRESRDSDAHPESLAIGVYLDETGSMGTIPESLAKGNLCQLMDTIIKHGVPHPQIMFGGIGDQYSDTYPLEVGQFESGNVELDEWLTSLTLEGGGGGGGNESYLLAWLFAARHTSIDCFEKRKIKGFLFTIGDERSWDVLDAAELKKIMGYSQPESFTAKQLLEEAKRMYHVFHIHMNCTGYRNDPSVLGYWENLIGKQNLIILDEHDAVAETIASIVAVTNGADLKNITKGFSSRIAGSVEKALAVIDKSSGVAVVGDGGVLTL
jgi:hypothetical protein